MMIYVLCGIAVFQLIGILGLVGIVGEIRDAIVRYEILSNSKRWEEHK